MVLVPHFLFPSNTAKSQRLLGLLVGPFSGNKIDIFFWREEVISLQELKIRCQSWFFPPYHVLFLPPKKEDFSAAAVIGKVKPWHFFLWRGLTSIGAGDTNKTVALVLLSWFLPFHSYAGSDLHQCCGSEEHGRYRQLWRRLPFTSSSARSTTALLLARRVTELMRWSAPH